MANKFYILNILVIFFIYYYRLKYIKKRPELICKVTQSFRVCFTQPPLNKNRHRNLPATRANLYACFTCSGRSSPIVWKSDGWPLHGQAGSPEGNSVPFGGRFPKEGSAFLGTRLSLGKSSVLYLCFRLTPGRGWL